MDQPQKSVPIFDFTDEVCLSQPHRSSKDQPRQKKRSHVQPQQPTTSIQVAEPIIPQDYNQFIGPTGLWEGFLPEAMEWEHDGSEKFDSVNSPATSYRHTSTPSGDFTGTGGYVMLPNRSSGAYSSGSGSNRTSDMSEQSQQAFYSPPLDGWTLGAERLMERETLSDFQHPANEQEHILLHLGAPQPQLVYDPYQHPTAATSSEYKYQDFEHYSYQTSTTEFSPPHKPHISSPPWNQLDHRVPRYEPSIAAFELSPGPAGTPQAQKNLHSPSCKSRTKEKKLSTRSSNVGPSRKDKAPSPGWECVVVGKGGLMMVSEHMDMDKHAHRGGRRKGALDEKTKAKAAKIRRLRACWSCWLLKVPCSEGEVCDRCLKYCSRSSFNSASGDQLCFRSGFNDFEPTFFPDFLYSHFDKRDINTLIDAGSNGFIGDPFEVQVHTGSVFDPLYLEIYSFIPKGWDSELLKQHQLIVDFDEQRSQVLCRYSAPVGLMALATSEMKETLREHIKQMVMNSQYTAQVTAGDANSVPALILDIAVKYHRANKSLLLRNALMLHAMHYFMGALVTFTEDSAINVLEKLPHLGIPQEPFLSSRLLNRQLKYVMHKIHKELTREVLEGLEKSMRSRTKDTWGPSFMTILVLCLCMEGLQTAADTFVVCDIKKEGAESELRRELSAEICKAVEKWPFQRCTGLFHDIYRSSRSGSKDGRFNPLKAMEVGAKTGLDDGPTEEMVKEIWRVVYYGHDTLQELAGRETIFWLDCEPCDIDPKNIKINNTGRLTAKFLMSFFTKEI